MAHKRVKSRKGYFFSVSLGEKESYKISQLNLCESVEPVVKIGFGDQRSVVGGKSARFAGKKLIQIG